MLTISDGVHHGAREDRSGEVLAERAGAAGHEIAWRGVLPDERDEIAACFARRPTNPLISVPQTPTRIASGCLPMIWGYPAKRARMRRRRTL